MSRAKRPLSTPSKIGSWNNLTAHLRHSYKLPMRGSRLKSVFLMPYSATLFTLQYRRLRWWKSWWFAHFSKMSRAKRPLSSPSKVANQLKWRARNSRINRTGVRVHQKRRFQCCLRGVRHSICPQGLLGSTFRTGKTSKWFSMLQHRSVWTALRAWGARNRHNSIGGGVSLTGFVRASSEWTRRQTPLVFIISNASELVNLNLSECTLNGLGIKTVAHASIQTNHRQATERTHVQLDMRTDKDHRRNRRTTHICYKSNTESYACVVRSHAIEFKRPTWGLMSS